MFVSLIEVQILGACPLISALMWQGVTGRDRKGPNLTTQSADPRLHDRPSCKYSSQLSTEIHSVKIKERLTNEP